LKVASWPEVVTPYTWTSVMLLAIRSGSTYPKSKFDGIGAPATSFRQPLISVASERHPE
jgi:hypothetical protein